ncbi:hypothetical protein AC1031_017663 [Aphanomyces cochlioides]|nr:hypothetical protein AC1031_017663 [Aphanomyces cochlioides]
MFGKKAGIPLDKIPPTVGLNIAKVDIARTNVIFWDLGGQERLRAIWSKYYSESHGIVFVIDSADEERFEESKTALFTMLDTPELSNVPLLILANKKDLATAKDEATLIERLALDTIPSAHMTSLRTISALTREGLDDAVTSFISTVKSSDRFLIKH